MKVRLSFVTNSSSTSYTVIVEEAYLKEVLAKVEPYVAAVAKALIKQEGSTQNFLGSKVETFGYTSGNYSTFEDFDFEFDGEIPKSEYDEEMNAEEAFGIFIHKLQENEEKCILNGVDG